MKKDLKLNYSIIENTAGKLFKTYDENLETQDNNFTIGFIGRYADWKNWPLAVEISYEMNKLIGKELNVVMAVGCLDENAVQETKKMFEKMRKKFGDRFYGRINISLEEIEKLYYKTDVFILTSDYNTESFGRTLVEAMSRKTAVLTTNAGGSVEVVNDYKNVCDNIEDFKNRILEFYNNPSILEKEKEKNMKQVKSRFSYRSNIFKHKELYSSILQIRKKR